MRSTGVTTRQILVRVAALCLAFISSTDALSTPVPRSEPALRPAPGAAILTVTRAGSGRGRVVSRPPGIVCGADCSEAYPVGTFLLLRARPLEGSTFTGWIGPCSGVEPCIVEMSYHRTVTAMFAGTF